MNRRDLLRWITRILRSSIVAVIGLPAVQYILDTFKRPHQEASVYRRVARLQDLPPEKPVLRTISGSRLDAWTQYEEEVIGRVWLTRQSSEVDAETPVIALSSICPHLGCQVRCHSDGHGYICPCHQAQFQPTGEIAPSKNPGTPSPAPRAMDALECRIAKDKASGELWVEVKYEKFKQGHREKTPIT